MKLILKGFLGAYVVIVVFSLMAGASIDAIVTQTLDAFVYFGQLYFMPFSRFVHDEMSFRVACIISSIIWIITIFGVCVMINIERGAKL